MNPTSRIQLRHLVSRPLAGIALLFSAVILPMVSPAPAAPIDQSYEYDALNRLTVAGTSTYQHDAAGNLVQMTTPVTPSLFATPSNRTVAYAANSSTTVSLTANVTWSAVSNQSWLTVSPASGTTSTTLTLTATTQNPSTSTRSATVTITGGSLTTQVTASQDGAPPPGTLVLTPTNLSISSSVVTGGSFAVTSTAAWSATSNQSWLTLTSASGTGNGTVTYNATVNTTAALRTAVVTVTSGTLTAQYTLNQQAPISDDHGGSIATATIIPTTASGGPGVLTASDEDYFRVTVPGPGILIAWTESEIDTYGYLLNAAGTLLDDDNDSNLVANFRISAAVTAGNYYVRLKGNVSTITGDYTLRTRFIPSSDPIQVSYLEKATNDVNLGFTGNSGVTYYILGSDDLNTWTQIGIMTGSGAENYTTLVGQGAFPKRFFRVSIYPATPAGFALIPAGNFLMGDQSNPLVGSSAELPVHSVYVSAFYMAKYEVTKELWDSVRAWGMANGRGYTDLAVGNGSYASKGANHPVHSITWLDMVKWCNARSEMENLMPCYYTDAAQTLIYKTDSVNIDNTMVKWNANGYRLPTEAEWEKAARGGLSGKNYPWGDTISHSQANFWNNGGEAYQNGTTGPHPTYAVGDYPFTSPVGSFAPESTYGLYDMSGNLWEWCWDWYDSGYYSASAAISNPHGPDSGSWRVVRGGSWGPNAWNCRVALRTLTSPGGNGFHFYMGFRPARSNAP